MVRALSALGPPPPGPRPPPPPPPAPPPRPPARPAGMVLAGSIDGSVVDFFSCASWVLSS
ncbi:hypothetical protein CSW57_18105 [Williamsia muralis]|uniref:Uncharacterized protein n=1 Tax=Williamsia marianensis TaxID=85044 RepID=A0A2G3PKM6_WILMA|nr:hypothetical protein CSW57_18105 [Williamsia marianensis]